MKNNKTKFLLLASIFLFSCSPQSRTQFADIGSSILNAAGVPASGNSVTNFLEAGDKLSKATRGFSDEQEYYLGRSVAAEIIKRNGLSTSPGRDQYINKVGKLLAQYSPRPEVFSGYHFAVMNNQNFNAVSAPAGFVFVSKGMVNQLKDEDSLAAVLAHEIAHVALGHGTAAISQSNVTSALAILGKEAVSYSADNFAVQALLGPFSDSVSDVVETLFEKGYSRSQEYEADLLAAEILKKAGYQVAALHSVLKVLDSQGSKEGGWYDTHPAPSKRLDELSDSYEEVAIDTSDAGYKARLARFKGAIK